jgi:protein-tyrosine-phosphatase
MLRETSTWTTLSDYPDLETREVSRRLAPAATRASRAALATIDAPIRVLFLCTHNSARSQVAEAALRMLGGSRVQAFSAGSQPTSVHPMATTLLAQYGIDVSQHRAKSMEEFAGQSFDYVITLCDGARDLCPTFPGDPVRIYWSSPDPSIEEDDDARAQAFATLWLELSLRIGFLLLLPHPASGRRIGPDSLAGRVEVPVVLPMRLAGGMTQKLGTFTHRLHLRRGA